MPERSLELRVESPGPGKLRLTLGQGDQVVGGQELDYEVAVDNLLLTTVDKLIRRHSIDRTAPLIVTVGAGIDKNSSLYRMVKSFAAAVSVSEKGPKGPACR